MIFDAVLSQTAETFLIDLEPEERADCYDALLDVLCADPYPDGVSKVLLPMPYAPGTIGFSDDQFWFAYVILNAACIGVAAIYWSPSSPKHPVNQRYPDLDPD